MGIIKTSQVISLCRQHWKHCLNSFIHQRKLNVCRLSFFCISHCRWVSSKRFFCFAECRPYKEEYSEAKSQIQGNLEKLGSCFLWHWDRTQSLASQSSGRVKSCPSGTPSMLFEWLSPLFTMPQPDSQLCLPLTGQALFCFKVFLLAVSYSRNALYSLPTHSPF